MDTSNLTRLLQPTNIVIASAVIGVIAVGGAYVYGGLRPAATYVTPTRGSITHTISASGSVKAAESVDLSFQLGGRIAYAGPLVGTRVSVGTTLASLSSADLQASLASAKAALATQNARLDSIKAGSRPEDVAVAETAVEGALSNMLQAKQAVLAAAQDAYIKSDDAIHNKVDQFFNNPRSIQPTLNLTISNSQLENDIESGRYTTEQLLTTWQQQINALPDDVTTYDITDLAATTKSNLTQVNAYLDKVASGLTQVVYTTAYPQATVQGYQSAVATGRAAVSTDITTLNSAVSVEKSTEAAYESAKSALVLKKAPATAADLEAQEAQVAAAQASVDAANAQIAKAVIAAPIGGTISRNDAHVGATASPGQALITLISDSAFQIEIYVSEADLAAVKAGQPAAVTLDSYGDSVPFPAHVLSVDPAATVQNGVPAYKVTLAFDENDARIQSGMTGNVTIGAESRDNALLVPSSAIIRKGSATFVLRQTTHGDELVAVQTGIDGATTTEIISGITESDRIRGFNQ